MERLQEFVRLGWYPAGPERLEWDRYDGYYRLRVYLLDPEPDDKPWRWEILGGYEMEEDAEEVPGEELILHGFAGSAAEAMERADLELIRLRGEDDPAMHTQGPVPV